MSKPCHILVVDDVPEMREVLERYMKQKGFTVSVAGSGNSALEILKQVDINIIVTDIMMDDGNGFELAEAARQMDPNIPIIFITGFEIDNAREKADSLGANGFLTKPFRINMLVDLCRSLCGDTEETS